MEISLTRLKALTNENLPSELEWMIFHITRAPLYQIEQITQSLTYFKDGPPGRRWLETALQHRKNDLTDPRIYTQPSKSLFQSIQEWSWLSNPIGLCQLSKRITNFQN